MLYALLRLFRYFDWVLFAAVVVLSAFGVAMIYSAAPTQGALLDEFWVRQLLYVLGGIVLLLFFAVVDYRFWETWPRLPYLAALAMLGLVAASGQTQFSAQRWLNLGSLPVQPSEIAKILIVLSLAKYLGDRDPRHQRWYQIILALALIGIPTLLIYLQPNLGTAVIVLVIGIGMLILWGMRARYVFFMAGALLIGAVVFSYTGQEYQKQRIQMFLNPESDPLGAGYNILQARISLGSGGWTGQGYLSGSQSQLRFLRARQTDFIFSVAGEELGFTGAVLFMGLLVVVMWRMLRAAEMSRDPYGRLIASGLTIMFFFQSVINLGMNVGLLPVAGVPLPFLSFGGSSVISILIGQGLVQSIRLRHRRLQFE